MSTERSPQHYSMEELCDQRTNLIREKQQAEEIVVLVREKQQVEKELKDLKG